MNPSFETACKVKAGSYKIEAVDQSFQHGLLLRCLKNCVHRNKSIYFCCAISVYCLAMELPGLPPTQPEYSAHKMVCRQV